MIADYVDENDCRLDLYECVLGGDQADESYCGNVFVCDKIPVSNGSVTALYSLDYRISAC